MNQSPTAVAAIVNPHCLAVNRGHREKMKRGTILQIGEGESPLALLKIIKVAEKFSLCEPFWVDDRCPKVKIGTLIYESSLNFEESDEATLSRCESEEA